MKKLPSSSPRFNFKLLIAVALALASPALAAETGGKQAVRTATNGDVVVEIVDQGGSTKLNIQGNNTAPGAGGGVQVLAGNVETSAPSYTNGNIAMPWLDTGGREYVNTDAATNLRTNITQIAGAAPSATNPMPAQLTDGTASYVGAKTGQLPTSLGQTTKSGSVSVTLASDQGTIPVSQGAPAGAASAVSSATNIASAATTTVTCVSSLTTSQPVKMIWAHVTSQSPAHCTIQYDNNGSLTKWGAVETAATSPSAASLPCAYGYCAVTAGSTGTQAIEASCTNLDSVANDFVCDVQYCSGSSC